MINTRQANKLMLFTQRSSFNSYLKKSEKVKEVQLGKLQKYISKNKNTTFGNNHNFKSITNYNDYKEFVPISESKDIESYIHSISNGEQNVLSKEKIIRFEETSGTNGPSKLIPYTADLLAEFRSAINCWMYSLSQSYPLAFKGKSYWSISPATRQQRFTDGGIPIGNADDKSYFNPLARYLLDKILVAPKDLNQNNLDEFYAYTSEYILAASNLSFISVWSPAFLIALDRIISANYKTVLKACLSKSTISRSEFNRLEKVLSKEFTWDEIWPDLKLISCWNHGQAKLLSQQLFKKAGRIEIQGKGLLSTECVCSIPIAKNLDPTLAYHSHFFEFRSANGDILLADQLMKGGVYEIIVTTGGGLYRYSTADLIEVTGFYQDIPCFVFIGRKNKTSDLVGEKITDSFVNKIFADIFKDCNRCTWVFIGVRNSKICPYQYVLNIESTSNIEESELNALTQKLSSLLSENLYYKEAVSLGQLAPLTYNILKPGTMELYKQKLFQNSNAQSSVFKTPTILSPREYLIVQSL